MKELEVKANIVGALMEHLNFTQARIKADEILSLIPDYEKGHCKDCCCAKSWVALGITEYTGKSIPEHIEELKDYGSQPNKWGLATKKKCSWSPHGNVPVESCPDCHGTGTITRILTVDEVGEFAKEAAESINFTNPSGELVVVLPGKEKE